MVKLVALLLPYIPAATAAVTKTGLALGSSVHLFSELTVFPWLFSSSVLLLVHPFERLTPGATSDHERHQLVDLISKESSPRSRELPRHVSDMPCRPPHHTMYKYCYHTTTSTHSQRLGAAHNNSSYLFSLLPSPISSLFR